MNPSVFERKGTVLCVWLYLDTVLVVIRTYLITNYGKIVQTKSALLSYSVPFRDRAGKGQGVAKLRYCASSFIQENKRRY